MINPWMIYLMSVADGLLMVSTIAMFGAIIWLMCILDLNGTLDRKALILLAISFLITLLIPSKSTMLAMIASQTITPDNLPTDMYNYVKDLYETCGEVVSNK